MNEKCDMKCDVKSDMKPGMKSDMKSDMKSGFAEAVRHEFDTKVARVRSLLAAKGLDAAFIKRQDNFAWLTCGGRNYVGMGEVGN